MHTVDVMPQGIDIAKTVLHKRINDELCEIDGVHVEAMPVQVWCAYRRCSAYTLSWCSSLFASCMSA